ncbi:MAG: PIN domain-containing protein [Deltaproteobacteria bacterium]|nr:PIN domain-containing protein [Deltaproteobacteria bacterium]
MILVDTSVWIEFFKKSPSIELTQLELFIEEGEVATCLPIQAELFSGEVSPKFEKILQDAFQAMVFVDPDWNSPTTWKNITEFSSKARNLKVGIPKLVDRMILYCAKQSKTTLWTLDKKLKKLAVSLRVQVY